MSTDRPIPERWRNPEHLNILGYVSGWGDRNRIDGTFVYASCNDEALKALGTAESLVRDIAELEDQLRQEREATEAMRIKAEVHRTDAEVSHAQLSTANEHLLTAIQQRDEAQSRYTAADESAYQLQAQVAHLQTTISQLTVERTDLRRELYLVQWVPTNAPFCPCCFNISSEGHKDECTLAAALYPDDYPATITPKPD